MCTSRATILEWLMGFNQLSTLLSEVGEPVTRARKEVKIEQCCKDIPGVAGELKAARVGAAGARQAFDFMKMVHTSGTEGAPERTERTKKTPLNPTGRALSAKKGRR